MPPQRCFCQPGCEMCSREGLREPPCLGMGPADAAFEVTAGPRSFIFTEKRVKTLGMAVIGTLFC